ncbi:efflux RND transporter periplasmic adaptor subunit [Vibrio agarivorans]|uniref:Efflux RND transporter periplasmic adaptor subunit n=1 Tax=Vibrio agarivorans TaxID=153622 RepID=A0ABT7Y068_9VIBR|nr:efflux RND transporter periplasmic adaptor subunit [Vibrio agarivorans]MDN2481433.1 efflux RND transporter periplasmic adaptor subunit [Vibrio agarivorans]
MRRFTLSTVALTCAATLGCSPVVEHRDKPQQPIRTLTMQTPIEGQERVFNGQVVPAELTPLSFLRSGELQHVTVSEGERVEEGQVIATLDNDTAAQQLADAKARLHLAASQLSRGKELKENNMISQAELDELSASHKLSHANYKLALRQLDYTELKAPYAGLVSEVLKQDFEQVSVGEPVVTIYDPSQVYVEISVSDSILARVEKGAKTTEYQPTAVFSGDSETYHLSYLEHTSELHQSSQSYQMWLSMPQTDRQIAPGTSVAVTVDMTRANLSYTPGFSVPMTAIDVDQHNFFVWKVEDNAVFRTPVQVDRVDFNGAVITNGLQQGDVIANSNLRKLREGMIIQGAQQ